jgi:hypothetical protein
MDTNPDSGLAARLAALLARAEAAHGEYEAATGVRDEQWPEWYAAYLRQNGLPSLLDPLPSRSNVLNNLASLLAEADKNYRSSGTSEPWPVYYARQFLALASEEPRMDGQT